MPCMAFVHVDAYYWISSCDMLMSTQYIAGVIDILELLMSTHYIGYLHSVYVLFMIHMLMSTQNGVIDMLDILMELLICCVC